MRISEKSIKNFGNFHSYRESPNGPVQSNQQCKNRLAVEICIEPVGRELRTQRMQRCLECPPACSTPPTTPMERAAQLQPEPEQEPEQEPEPERGAAAKALPWGWGVATSSKTGQRYYWNQITGESTYSLPRQIAVPQACELPCGVETLKAGETAEARGQFVEALAAYNTAIAEALVLVDRHPALRALVDELMERALRIRPKLLDECSGDSRRQQPTTPTRELITTPSRMLINVAAAASAAPRDAGVRDDLAPPLHSRAPVNARDRRASRGFKKNPAERPVNKRIVVQSHERAVSADASHNDAHEYDERSPRHYRRTGSSKAVAWGSPTGRFNDTDPASHFYRGVKSPPSVASVRTDRSDSTRAPESPAASRSKGVAWGTPTRDRFNETVPGSHLHSGSVFTPSPAHYEPPVRPLLSASVRPQ